MSLQSNNNKRIAKNTLLLNFRMLFTSGITNLRAEHTESVWSVRFWYIVVLGGGMAMFMVTKYSWILKYIYNDYIK